jgi:hypothetical protein
MQNQTIEEKKKKTMEQVIKEQIRQPTIVNEESKFVVITYWWGRGNINANVARPCMSDYQAYIDNVIKHGLLFFGYLYSNKVQQKYDVSNPENVLNVWTQHLSKMTIFKNFIDKQTNNYINSLYIDIGLLDNKDKDLFNRAKASISMMREDGQAPRDFTLFDNVSSEQELRSKVSRIFREVTLRIYNYRTVASSILNLYNLRANIDKVKKILSENRGQTSEEYDEILDIVKDGVMLSVQERTSILSFIKTFFTTKQTEPFNIMNNTYTNTSIYEAMVSLLQFRSTMKYEDMINRWEKSCKYANCNYLALEYNHFVETKQYQMAINAKPLFIQHALTLCNGRAVLYIDGDMFIRKYPAIFDIDGVDFMARGWNMDPRASDNILSDIIHYNPYKFETSGGIMYFSNTYEAKMLMDIWIKESDSPSNKGKADDRIISMIFNMKKYMLNMNIIQLPVEYLWLTIAYDDFLLGTPQYDWDKEEMDSTIYIDHPECLTSEETAAKSGASNDRAPKLYKFLDTDDDIPVSESFYEYFAYPSKHMAQQFQSYHNFMKKTTYSDINDTVLQELGFVDPTNSDNNAQPLFITPYDQQYGNLVAPKNNKQIIDNLKETNFWSSQKGKQLLQMKINNTIILCESKLGENNGHQSNYLIPYIIDILNMGLSVIYLPNNCKKECYLTLLNDYLKKMENNNTGLDLAFIPNINKMTHMLKPAIDLEQPIYFNKSSTSSLITKALSLYNNIEEMSKAFNYGAYQIISRIRIGYVYKKSAKKDSNTYIENYCSVQSALQPQQLVSQSAGTRTNTITEYQINEYLDGQMKMYGSGKISSKKRKTNKRKHKRLSNKKKKTSKKRAR